MRSAPMPSDPEANTARPREAPQAPRSEAPADAQRRAVADERPTRMARTETPPVPTVAPTPAVPQPTPAPAPTPESRDSQRPGFRRNALLDWEPIVARLRETHPALAAMVEQSEARVVSKEKLVLGFEEGSFFGRQASQPEALAALAAAAHSVLGATPQIELKLDKAPGTKTRTLADVEKGRRDAEGEQRRRAALGHPAVLDALDVFPDARGSEEVRFDND